MTPSSDRQRARFSPILDFVRWHAMRRPLHPAVMRDDVAVGYAELHRDLLAMTTTLAGFNLPPGAIAAIAHDDPYIQLLMVFGFESLGVVTGSFRPGEGADCTVLLRLADLVLATHEVEATCRIVHLTQDWVTAALAGPGAPLAPPVCEAGAGLVIFHSSGTTGQPKAMLLTHAMLHERLARQREPERGLGLTAQSRFLAAMHLGVGSMYMAAANCLRLGATYMFRRDRPIAEALTQLRPTHMTILPFQLRGLLDRLPPPTRYPLLPDLTVQTIGAPLTGELRRRALREFCGQIRENYGSNETGAIGVVDEIGTVALTRGVEAQIIGEDGAVLPAGSIGAVRLRARSVITGYLDDPAASAEMFRAGWFHPGDLAALAGLGQLRLVGRRHDVLNLGGFKVASAELESMIIGQKGLRDVAMVQPAGLTAAPRVVVCVVADPAFESAPLLAKLRSILNFPFILRAVPSIPRTAEGKIRRAALMQSLNMPARDTVSA